MKYYPRPDRFKDMIPQKVLTVSLLCHFLILINTAAGQMITGIWKGKIGRQRAEVKIIQQGDSLTGTSYYYESAVQYRRYSIKGYFNQQTNEVVWWDDQLLDERTGKTIFGSPGKIPLLASADFNCPGDGRMMLDGKAAGKENERNNKGDLHLDKTEKGDFEDEWDYVINNFTEGANDPFIIDSIKSIAGEISVREIIKTPEEAIQVKPAPSEELVVQKEKINSPKPEPDKKEIKSGPKPQPAPIEQKFITRQKVFTKEIPVAGDSIELRFYDNAEVDGDSISLFLNDKLVFEHIRLTANAYTIKLSVNDLKESNELVMVAENLGSIPPNTSYMVAIVKEERYDARLASTEGSSAMIRLVKATPPNPVKAGF